jgi:hypothetical protein
MSVTATLQNRQVLDRFLNPVRDILTREVAQAIADLRADPVTQDRIEDLAHRHHEGQLTSDELSEYEALVNGANLIAVLQAKARSVLTQRPES